MRITSVVLSLLSILIGLSAKAQTARIAGTVLDKDGAPVNNAQLYLEPEGELQTTGEDGRFAFDGLAQNTTYQLTVFAPTYTTVIRSVIADSPEKSLTFKLEALSVTGKAVEVRDRGQAFGLGRLRNVEGTAIYAAKKNEVIDLEELVGNLAANNPREVFRGVAGLNIWENDGSGLQLNIGARGLNPNRTSNFNTRQNGYDISADALGYPESYYTPPTLALRRIEVVRGAASLQYGTQFGGLLNFVFKDGPEDQAFEFVSDNTAGSYGLINSFNSIGGSTDQLNYYAFYQRKQGDGWRPNSGFDQNTVFGSVKYQPTERLQVGLEFTHMDYLAQQPGGLVDFEFERDPRQSKRERNWFRVDWNLAALKLDYRFSQRTRLNSRSFYLHARREAVGELGPINRPDPMRERDLIRGRYRNFGNETRLAHRYNLNGRPSTFLAGFRIYHGFTRNQQGDADDGGDPDFTFLNPEDLEQSDYDFPSRNYAFFVENLFNLTDRLTVTPGARLEYIKTTSEGYFKQRVFSGGEVIFEQRFEDSRRNERTFALFGLGIGYRLNDELEVYGNVSQNFRAINFSDLSVVNPNLKVDSLLQDERGFNADLGFRGQLLNNSMRFDASLFYLHYRDRIGLGEITLTDRIGLEQSVAFRTNIGDARIFGLETYAEFDIYRYLSGNEATGLSLFANFSLLESAYLSGGPAFEGNEVEQAPPMTLKTGLLFKHRNFRVSCQFSYVRRHYSDATNAMRVSDATRGIIPSYQVMDASLSYQWSRFRFQFGVNNLLDAAYFTRRATAYPGPGIIPAEARSFYGGVRVKF